MRFQQIFLLLAGFCIHSLSFAQLSVDHSLLSFDIDTVQLGGALGLSDDQLLSWSPGGGYTVLDQLPDGLHADLAAYTISNSQIFMAFDTTVSLLDGTPQNNVVTVTPAELVAFNGGDQYTRITLPALASSNVQIDGLSVDADGFLLSLNTTTRLADGSTTVAEPADVFHLNKEAGHPILFDASEMGLAPGLNVDAISWDKQTELLYLSFDSSGFAGPKRFDANTILVYDPAKETLLIWDNATNGLASASLNRGANLNAMMLAVVAKPDLIFGGPGGSFEAP